MHSKEDFIHYILCGDIHLSKNDYGFFYNIQKLLKTNKFITENQDKLFNKLILKYQRQLKKYNKDINFILSLPWNAQIVKSLPEFTSSKIFLREDELIIKSPFDKSFVSAMRNNTLMGFEWDKDERVYKTKFSTYALKNAMHLCKKYYKEVNIVGLDEILEQIELYDNYVWEPTLTSINGNLTIVCNNEHIDRHLVDIMLSLDANCLLLLSRLGVKIDDKLLTTKKQKFFSSFKAVVDSSELQEVCEWLKESQINYYHLRSDSIFGKDKSFQKILQDNELLCITEAEIAQSPDIKYVEIVSDTTRLHILKQLGSACKSIVLKNSKPVFIK